MDRSLIQTILRKASLMVGFGKINHYTKGDLAQTSWDSDHDCKDETLILQHFGFKSIPPKGTGCLGICNGNRENIHVIATECKSPIKLAEGETILFSEKGGKLSCSIHLNGNGVIEMKAESLRLNVQKMALGESDLLAVLTDLVDTIKLMMFANSGPMTMPPTVKWDALKQQIEAMRL